MSKYIKSCNLTREELKTEDISMLKKKYPHHFFCKSCDKLFFSKEKSYDICINCVDKLPLKVYKDEEEYDDGFWRIMIETNHHYSFRYFNSWKKEVINLLRKELREPQNNINIEVKQSCDNWFAVYPLEENGDRKVESFYMVNGNNILMSHFYPNKIIKDTNLYIDWNETF